MVVVVVSRWSSTEILLACSSYALGLSSMCLCTVLNLQPVWCRAVCLVFVTVRRYASTLAGKVVGAVCLVVGACCLCCMCCVAFKLTIVDVPWRCLTSGGGGRPMCKQPGGLSLAADSRRGTTTQWEATGAAGWVGGWQV